MPVNFLTQTQKESYGRYDTLPAPGELARFFHMSGDDLSLIGSMRGGHNRLGFALQLGTVRFLGTFLSDPIDVPASVLEKMAGQLGDIKTDRLKEYSSGRLRWDHASQIRSHYGYQEITDPYVGFRLNRWLCALSWTGTDRPSVLFDRAKSWLLTNKILLPGVSTLERQVSHVRARMAARVWRLLVQGVSAQQRKRLEELLIVPEDSRHSLLDRLRTGPVRVSAPSLVKAIARLKEVRTLGI